MSEEAPKEKKWTEWSVVSMGDGTYRCKRTNVADKEDVEYRLVPRPVFKPEELVAMAKFGLTGLVPVEELVNACYSHRHKAEAFYLCGRLNEEPK